MPDPPVAVPGPASARCSVCHLLGGDHAVWCSVSPGPASVSPAGTRELDGLRKLYGQKYNAIVVALGHACEAQDKLAADDVDGAADALTKVVSILVDA